MAEKKYFDIKNDIYQKEVIAKLRKEVSVLIKENEYLRNRVKDLEEINESHQKLVGELFSDEQLKKRKWLNPKKDELLWKSQTPLLSMWT